MDDMQARGTRTHPYPAGGHRRQLWFGVLLVMMSPVVLLPGADLLGLELPSALQWTLAVFAIGLGLRLTTWAWRRARTDEPAVAVLGRQLHLHTHPGRRVALHRDDILGVEPVRELTGLGPRWMHGTQGFRIITSASGIRTMHLVIGNRMVADPIEDVHATVERFATDP